MQKKINVGILFGGKSVEHEVSLQSACSVINAINREKYDLHLIGIDKRGKWHFFEEKDYLFDSNNPKTIALGIKKGEVELLRVVDSGKIDVIFPVLHGNYGEDGTVQGLLKLANIPYVGAGVLGSAVGMDKDVMKRLVREAGVPTAKFLVFQSNERENLDYTKVSQTLGSPFYVKPANSGSSIGISKVSMLQEFEEAIDFAFQFDRKILIEEAIIGVEIQIGLIGNESPLVSLPCKIIPKTDFHSYAAKYLESSPLSSEIIIPALLEKDQLHLVQEMALKAYKTLCCEGMARVDLFLSNEGKLYFNEINTIPGLTKKSPYVKMWEATGLTYSEMIDRLIDYAIDRFQKEQQLVSQIEVEKQECQLDSTFQKFG